MEYELSWRYKWLRVAYLGQARVGKLIKDECLLLAVAMLQVLALVNATGTNCGQAHTVAYEDDNVLGFVTIRVLLRRLGLPDSLLQLPQTHLAPECSI